MVRVTASFLKVFQLLIFAGGSVASIGVIRKKNSTPVLLLLLTFVGGYLFHIIWESSPFYTMAYMVILIPAGVSGYIELIRRISALNLKTLSKAKIQITSSGCVVFLTGTAMFLLAAAGLGTIRLTLAEGLDD